MVLRKNQTIDTQSPSQIANRYYTNKYFASNQALVFIVPYLLDEALAVSYKIEQRKVLIYGYASQYYDAVASGKVIVSGTLTVNYIDSAYLYYAMMESVIKNNGKTTYQSVIDSISYTQGLGNQIASKLGKITAKGAHHDIKTQSADMRDIAQLITTDPIAGKEIIQNLREKYWSGNKMKENAFTPNASITVNGTGGSGLSDAFLGDNLFARPDQMPPINITISHGSPLQVSQSTHRVIRELDFISMEQHISPSGQPQAETYSFIAKSIA